MKDDFIDKFKERDFHKLIVKASRAEKLELIEKSLNEYVLFNNKIFLSSVIQFSDKDMFDYIAQHPYAQTIISYAAQGKRFYKRGRPSSKKTYLRNIKIVERIYQLYFEEGLAIKNELNPEKTAFFVVAQEFNKSESAISGIWKNRDRNRYKNIDELRRFKELRKNRTKFTSILLGGQLTDFIRGN